VAIIGVYLLHVVDLELRRVIDQVVDASIAWLKQHRRRDEKVEVEIYGPCGKILKRIRVRQRVEGD
jgi:hypothetical protein